MLLKVKRLVVSELTNFQTVGYTCNFFLKQ